MNIRDLLRKFDTIGMIIAAVIIGVGLGGAIYLGWTYLWLEFFAP